jgi:hypothetical protein
MHDILLSYMMSYNIESVCERVRVTKGERESVCVCMHVCIYVI